MTIVDAIRLDWMLEICKDWESGMDEQEIAKKHSITVEEVNEVLIKADLKKEENYE